jgi:uncharacterized protein (DUF736 family)
MLIASENDETPEADTDQETRNGPRRTSCRHWKTGDIESGYPMVSQGVEIGAAWVRKSESSGKDYVSLALAAPEFGPRRLYANLGRAAGQDDPDVFAVIWNPED